MSVTYSEVFPHALWLFRADLAGREANGLDAPTREEAARLGFASRMPAEEWTDYETSYIAECVEKNQLPDVDEYGELTPRVVAFDYYLIGVRLALAASGELDQPQFEASVIAQNEFLHKNWKALEDVYEPDIRRLEHHALIRELQDGLRAFEISEAGSIELFWSRSLPEQEACRQRYFGSVGPWYAEAVGVTGSSEDLAPDILLPDAFAKFQRALKKWQQDNVTFWTQRYFAKLGLAAVDGEYWRTDADDFIVHRLRSAFSHSYMAAYAELSPLIIAFNCFALGMLLGLYEEKKINDAYFLKLDLNLVNFSDREWESICEADISTSLLPADWIWYQEAIDSKADGAKSGLAL